VRRRVVDRKRLSVKVYVPKDQELRMEIIQLYYNIPVAEHRGKWQTTELVTRNY